jgi:hypothetical protein
MASPPLGGRAVGGGRVGALAFVAVALRDGGGGGGGERAFLCARAAPFGFFAWRTTVCEYMRCPGACANGPAARGTPCGHGGSNMVPWRQPGGPSVRFEYGAAIAT